MRCLYATNANGSAIRARIRARARSQAQLDVFHDFLLRMQRRPRRATCSGGLSGKDAVEEALLQRSETGRDRRPANTPQVIGKPLMTTHLRYRFSKLTSLCISAIHTAELTSLLVVRERRSTNDEGRLGFPRRPLRAPTKNDAYRLVVTFLIADAPRRLGGHRKNRKIPDNS